MAIISILCIASYFSGFAYAGFFNPNVLDLAPPLAGTLTGITNTLADMNGFIAPQIAGYLIRDQEHSVAGWSNVWIMSLVLLIFGGIFYALTSSAEKQPWADEKMNATDQLKYEVNQIRRQSIAPIKNLFLPGTN